MGLVIAKRQDSLVGNSGCGGGAGGYAPSAGAHGFGDHFELVGARFIVLLLVLDATVVLKEELARLLQHSATLADGTVGHKQRENMSIYFLFEVVRYISCTSVSALLLMTCWCCVVLFNLALFKESVINGCFVIFLE